jgi:hypothetical protein
MVAKNRHELLADIGVLTGDLVENLGIHDAGTVAVLGLAADRAGLAPYATLEVYNHS